MEIRDLHRCVHTLEEHEFASIPAQLVSVLELITQRVNQLTCEIHRKDVQLEDHLRQCESRQRLLDVKGVDM